MRNYRKTASYSDDFKAVCMSGKAELDPTDIAMLEILQEEGRISVSDLGRKVGLSQPATSERMKRLEGRGIIVGYKAVIEPKQLGLGMTAIIRVRTTHDKIGICLKQFAQMPQVMEVHRLTGEDCFHLKVIVPSPESLETIVDSVARHGSVITSLILRSETPKIFARDLLRSGRP